MSESEKNGEVKAEATPEEPKTEGFTAEELAFIAEAQAKRAAEKAAEAKATAEAKAQEEYEAAAKEAAAATADSGFTNKRAGEQIFRREMAEPEFWLTKKDLVPPRPILSKEEEDAISERVEIPADQTPEYKPEHILSPEYQGMSNYEAGVGNFRQELEEQLAKMKSDPEVTEEQISKLEDDLTRIDTLYENFYEGMNVFRTAKGGRDKIKK